MKILSKGPGRLVRGADRATILRKCCLFACCVSYIVPYPISYSSAVPPCTLNWCAHHITYRMFTTVKNRPCDLQNWRRTTVQATACSMSMATVLQDTGELATDSTPRALFSHKICTWSTCIHAIANHAHSIFYRKAIDQSY